MARKQSNVNMKKQLAKQGSSQRNPSEHTEIKRGKIDLQTVQTKNGEILMSKGKARLASHLKQSKKLDPINFSDGRKHLL